MFAFALMKFINFVGYLSRVNLNFNCLGKDKTKSDSSYEIQLDPVKVDHLNIAKNSSLKVNYKKVESSRQCH